jgi:hemolysin III
MVSVTTRTVHSAKLRPGDIGKPRMRGWLHTYAFFVAAVCGLFGVSALYHRRVWSPHGYQTMRRLDHSMIFIFIAGTYTPFSVLLLPRTMATMILAVAWGGALAGVAMKLIWTHAPRWIGAILYIALGWIAVIALPDFMRSGGVAVLVLLAAGGLAYTVGAVFYALRRPNPWPTVFGHHEFFHACTLVAAICHHVALYFALYA